MNHEGQPARVVGGSATFDTTPNDLWDALTTPDRIRRWFMPVSGDLKTGGRYQLEGNAGGKIIRCDPPEAFDVTWEWGENISWVRVRLDIHDGGTRLTLEHIMLKDEASEEHWRKYGPGATGVGWDLSFVALDQHLRTGEAIPPGAADSWSTTEGGKTFVRQSAAAWGDAHIDFGETESVAREMAGQTAKFYCGEG
ncbi:MAG: SRPBCC family protein [Planctomycetota bacterium]